MAEGSAPYLRVAAAFRARVADGTWPRDFRLPSRSELGREFQVGENVVRRAQELLIQEGLLEGRAGSGTYVSSPCKRRRMVRSAAGSPGGQTHSGVAPFGFDGTWESDSSAKVPAPEGVAARLGIEAGALCVRTFYEFLSDRQPVMLATSWEPMAVTGGTVVVLPEGGPLAGRGVAARMAHIGVEVTRVVEVARPVHVDREQGQLLGSASAGAQATMIERTHYDSTGRPVETADILVPAAQWDIAYEIALDPAEAEAPN